MPADLVPDHAPDCRTAYRSEDTLIGEQRTCHATHGRTSDGTFFLGCHVGTARQAE
jgi:hypothetical protein